MLPNLDNNSPTETMVGKQTSNSMLNVISDSTKSNNKSKKQKITHNKYYQSNKIFNYMINTSHPEEEDTTDNMYGATHTIKSKDTIRLWFTNPCGLGVDPHSLKSDDSLHFLRHKSKCDIFGLAETNLHWKLLHNSATLYARVRQKWRYFKLTTSHNSHAKLGKTQRGGTCMVTVGQAAYRHYAHGEDTSGLGRWCWMEFRVEMTILPESTQRIGQVENLQQTLREQQYTISINDTFVSKASTWNHGTTLMNV